MALAVFPASAGEARWYVQLDNDVVFDTDRWYTSGVRIARVNEGIEVGVLQEVYTPEGGRFAHGVDDRRPAGRLLASVAKHWTSVDAFQTFEIMAGVRGPSALGRQTTRAIHRLIPAPFVDWSRQFGDEFDGAIVAERSQRTGPFTWHAGAQLGNQVAFAHGGLEARFGPAAGFASRLLRFAATPDLGVGSGWAAYAGASIRGVGRNKLLSGNYDPRLRFPIDMERAVWRLAAGVAWRAAWGAVTFDLAQDSREFSQQREPQRFGSLAVQFAF